MPKDSKSRIKIGYAPYSDDFSAPGDKRRFVAYARSRGLNFEIATPGRGYDLLVLSELCDLSNFRYNSTGVLVFDFIDSYLAAPRWDFKSIFRGPAGYLSGRYKQLVLSHRSALKELCEASSAVVCTTQTQKNTILGMNENVHIILDVHDSLTLRPKSDYRRADVFNLVWEGLPASLHHLEELISLLEDLNRKYPVCLNVITDKTTTNFFKFIRPTDNESRLLSRSKFINFHLFDLATWTDVVRTSDLAVIPIDKDKDYFGWTKPENKLLLFWKMGLPTLTSPTPAYSRAQQAVFGDLENICASSTDWLEKIVEMLTNEELRSVTGQRGRAYAEKNYNREALFDRWDDLFRSVGFDFSPD